VTPTARTISPYLHYGQIPSARVVREARATGVGAESLEAFVNQVTTCNSVQLVPADARRCGARVPGGSRRWPGCGDTRPVLYDLETLESATTRYPTGRRTTPARRHGADPQLSAHAQGKTMLLWTHDTKGAPLFHLNDNCGRARPVGSIIMKCTRLWIDRGATADLGRIRPMVVARS
jgi:deoxyribodipyrimidine photo-lyase